MDFMLWLTLDIGATSNMVCTSSAKLSGFPITLASQMARQAYGVTPMDVIGKVHCYLTCRQWTFEFMVLNDIDVHPAKRQIEIGGTEIISYSSPSRHTRQPNVRHTIFPATQPKPLSCSARGVRPVQDPF